MEPKFLNAAKALMLLGFALAIAMGLLPLDRILIFGLPMAEVRLYVFLASVFLVFYMVSYDVAHGTYLWNLKSKSAPTIRIALVLMVLDSSFVAKPFDNDVYVLAYTSATIGGLVVGSFFRLLRNRRAVACRAARTRNSLA